KTLAGKLNASVWSGDSGATGRPLSFGAVCSFGQGCRFSGMPGGLVFLKNGLVERLIGSARRECTDHVIVFNEDHLRRILSKYASYYNEVRTHLSLGKDAPCRRPIERFGDIIAQPVLGGLHHRYARI